MKIHSLWLAAKDFCKRTVSTRFDTVVEAFTSRKSFAYLEGKCEKYAREGDWERYQSQRHYTNYRKAEVRICQGAMIGLALAGALFVFGHIYIPASSTNGQPPGQSEASPFAQPAIVIGSDGSVRFEKDDRNRHIAVAFKNGALEMTETTPTGSRRLSLTGDRALRGINTMERIKDMEINKGFKVPIDKAERVIDSLTSRLIVDLSNS